MNQNVKLWLRAANPFTPPRGMAEAQRAARVGSGILAVAALASSVTVIRQIVAPDHLEGLLLRQYEHMGLPPETVDTQMALMEAMRPMIVLTSLGTVALLVGLAVVQWRKMTRVIPILLLGFAAYRILGSLAVFLTGFAPLSAPTGWAVANWLLFAISLPLTLAAYRGSTILEKLKRAR